MKSKTPDKFLNVRKLVRKLGELAAVLDDVSKKMHTAAEKQRATLTRIEEPTREDRRLLNSLHKKLESIELIPLEDVEIQHAQEISKKLLEPSARSRSSSKMTYHEYVEFTGIEEFNRFRSMPALDRDELESVDWDEFYDRMATID